MEELEKRFNLCEERCLYLEKTNGNLRWFVVIAVISIILLTAGGANQKTPRIVEAERFALRDKNNNIRSELSIDKDGAPRLFFCDKDGNPLVLMGVGEGDAPRLNLYGKNGHSISLSMDNGEPSINMFIDRSCLRLKINTDHSSQILAFDKEGCLRVGLAVNSEGASGIAIYDKNGKSRFESRVEIDGSPSFSLRQEDGRPLFQIPFPTPDNNNNSTKNKFPEITSLYGQVRGQRHIVEKSIKAKH